MSRLFPVKMCLVDGIKSAVNFAIKARLARWTANATFLPTYEAKQGIHVIELCLIQ